MRNLSSITYHLSRQEGQSLVEVVVALGVAVLVVVALVRGTVTSIRNANFAKNRALATKYAQESNENIRAYRDQNDWLTFTTKCQSLFPDFNPLPPDSIFDWKIACSGSGDTREIKVTVEWTDAQVTHKSELTTRLTNWR